MKLIVFYLKWVLYFLITISDREKYLIGKEKGYDCINIKNDIFSSTYSFNPNKTPTRNYKTFKEYKLLYYPYEK